MAYQQRYDQWQQPPPPPPQQQQQHLYEQHQHPYGGGGQYGAPQPGGPQRTMSGSVGATFYPGRDDYMMPELSIVSPSPQRVMPEMPDQIAGNLENLELDSKRGYGGSPGNQGISYPSAQEEEYMKRHSMAGEPAYSAFPRLVNPGPNIPPTDEEKAAQIDEARADVLASNDPEMQLIWAQDALTYVDISMSYLARIAKHPGVKPQMPPLELQLQTDALNVVNFLADQHHPRAEFMKGNWLEFGKFGHPTDKKEAFRCYARSAERGYARAEYRMGMQFENSGEPMKAIKHYNQGAALEDSPSNYRLGMMTLLGQHGQRQDFARGVQFIRIAADNADENAPQGAYVYGLLLAGELPGIDVPEHFLPQDQEMAREMVEKAAFLGFSRAQLKMGSAYELCQLGCDFNPALSLHYNALAARQGEPEAEMSISKWFLCGHEGTFDKNEELAYVYARRAAKSELPTAEFAIGYFFEIGMYVPIDLKEAQHWYQKAAGHGNKDAAARIEGLSRSKTLTRRDHEEIAVRAIRARHGSMRKKVNPLTERGHYSQPSVNSIPEKRNSGPPTLPPISGIDMPLLPPAGTYGYPPAHQEPHPPPQRRPSSQIPPLNTSFIRTDGAPPYQGPQSAIARPQTTLPYPPTDDMRPLSAVGYGPQPRPNQFGRGHRSSIDRPNSIATVGPGIIPPAGTYPAQVSSVPPRTTSAMSGINSGYGGPQVGPHQGRRPVPGRGRPGYPGNGTMSPAPGRGGYPMDGMGTPGPGRGGYPPDPMGPPQGRGGYSSPAPGGRGGYASPAPGGRGGYGQGPTHPLSPPPPDNYYPPQQSPPMGIGFIAPPTPKPQQHPQPPKSPAPGGRPNRNSGGRPTPGQQSPPRQSRTPQPHQQQQLQQRPSATPAPQQPPPPPKSATPKPPPSIAGSTNSAGSGVTQPAPPKPPGKGPKTFEEMGVPQSQKEQDCVIM